MPTTTGTTPPTGKRKGTRRPPGSGSVYQRADGRWVAAVRVGGRKLVRYARTKAEAKAQLARMLAEAAGGRLSPSSPVTLAEWAARWLLLVEGERRPSTVRTYRETLRPLLDRLGHVRLHRLSAQQLALTFSALRRDGMGTRRLQLAYAAVHTCLESARRYGLIAANPVSQVLKPRHTPTERRLWTVEETARFIAVAGESRLKDAPVLLLLLGGGLRLSEALGLTWDDVDLDRGVVRIDKALVWAGGEAHLGPPKSKSGRREVRLPGWAVDALARMPRPVLSGPVFVTQTGEPVREASVRKTLVRLCERAGLPPLGLHDLRHLSASLLLDAGLSVPAVAARLGHARPSITLAVYAHHLRGEDRGAEVLDRLLAWANTDRWPLASAIPLSDSAGEALAATTAKGPPELLLQQAPEGRGNVQAGLAATTGRG